MYLYNNADISQSQKLEEEWRAAWIHTSKLDLLKESDTSIFLDLFSYFRVL